MLGQTDSSRRWGSMAELKPCPFCGGRKLAVNGWCEQYWVTCSECETEGPSGETQTEAKEAWNRRATDGQA